MTAKSRVRTEQPNVADRSLAVPTHGGDHDVLIRVIELLGRKWHPVILRCLMTEGALRFNALKDEIAGVSSKVLSDSLDDLEEKEFVERTVVDERPIQVEYELTERGRTIRPVLVAMQSWGEQNLEADG